MAETQFKLRELKFQQLTQPEKAGEGLLDIPHPLILRYKSPDELIKQFQETWGMPPKGVILPAVVNDGLLYEYLGTGLTLSRHEKEREGKYLGFAETIKAFGEIATINEIYLSVDPTLQFITTDGLHVEDIVGDGSQQVCVGNPRTQELLGSILGRGIDIALNALDDHKKLTGAVIDAVDLWPQGASNGRLELTCFCESCQRYFDSREKDLIIKFKDFPNPWNLVLRDNQTGIGYIDELPPGTTSQQIIGLSRLKGYLEIFKDKEQPELLQLAKDLLSYIKIRHDQTVMALDKVFEVAFDGLELEHKPRRIVLLEGIHLDWTSGLQLKGLDGKTNYFDEIWFNSTSPEIFMEKIAFRSYMWRRSRYLIDAFFQAVANATDPGKRTTTGIARWSKSQIREELLLKRLLKVVSTSDSTLTSLVALPPLRETKETPDETKVVSTSDSTLTSLVAPSPLNEETPEEIKETPERKKTAGSQRVGFVGVAFFSEEEGRKFITDLKIPDSGEADASILEAIRQLRSMSNKD